MKEKMTLRNIQTFFFQGKQVACLPIGAKEYTESKKNGEYKIQKITLDLGHSNSFPKIMINLRIRPQMAHNINSINNDKVDP